MRTGLRPCMRAHRTTRAFPLRAARLREDVVEERDDEQALLGRVEEVAELHTTPWLGQNMMQRRLEDAHVPAVFMPPRELGARRLPRLVGVLAEVGNRAAAPR